ncbi:hypothetical protein HPG69_007046, partial [Diceros bicornis minor]
ERHSVGWGPGPPTTPRPATTLPPGSATQALHGELPSQKQHLRHLRNIAARNIINRNGHQLPDTYFTFHLCNTEKIYKEFYRSEVIKNSLNPTWLSLDFGIIPGHLDTSVSCFLVLCKCSEEYSSSGGSELCLQFLCCLFFTAMRKLRLKITVLTAIACGYWRWHPCESSGSQRKADVDSMLHRTQCAIKQTQITVQKIGKEIEEKLTLTSTSNELKKESECLQLKILVLRNELERQKKALTQETSAQLTICCRQLLSELSYIYPMDLSEHRDYFICGVKLASSEDFQAKDDGSIAVAVGEKLQFDYGVYHLNENIAQLRYQHGVGTPDLRQTPPNLKNFMEQCNPCSKETKFHIWGCRCRLLWGDPFTRQRPLKMGQIRDRKTPVQNPCSQLQVSISPACDHHALRGIIRKTTSLSSLDTSLDFSKEKKKRGVDLGDSSNGGHVSVNTSQEQGKLSGRSATVNGTLPPSEQAGSSSVQLQVSSTWSQKPSSAVLGSKRKRSSGWKPQVSSGDQLEALTASQWIVPWHWSVTDKFWENLKSFPEGSMH